MNALAVPTLMVADGTALSGRPVMLILAMAALSLLPFVVLLMTSFVKIAVVLSILKSALGTPQIPPGQVVTGLALLLTVYIMAPTGERMLAAVEPVLQKAPGAGLLSDLSIDVLGDALSRAKEPLRAFMVKHASPKDRGAFLSLARKMRTPEEGARIGADDFLVLAPAFLSSELRRAFEIGFLLFVPFLIVDMVVANLLLALGMHMLAPNTVSLPFKLLLFVMADGWHLVLRGLVESYL